MLLQPNLRPPWPLGPSHACAKCGEMVPGLAVGGICSDCWRKLVRRAANIGRWVAMGTSLPLAVYLTIMLPAERNARLLGVVTVLIWYVLTSLIAKRVALEWMK